MSQLPSAVRAFMLAVIAVALRFVVAPVLAAPQVYLIPLVDPSPEGAPLQCDDWRVLRFPVVFPFGAPECENPAGVPLYGSCTNQPGSPPKIHACCSLELMEVAQDIWSLRAHTDVTQQPTQEMMTHPCSCSGDSPVMSLLGERTSTLIHTTDVGISGRLFEVKATSNLRLVSEFDVRASCAVPSCAGGSGSAEWQFYQGLSSLQIDSEMMANGHRSIACGGAGFCTGQSPVGGGFEISFAPLSGTIEPWCQSCLPDATFFEPSEHSTPSGPVQGAPASVD